MAENVHDACCIGGNEDLKRALAEIWGPDVAAWTFFSEGHAAIGVLLTSPPDILICSMAPAEMPDFAVARILKKENVYSQVPVVMCLSPEEVGGNIDWNNLEADDFFIFPSPKAIIKARLDLALGRATRTLDANPLTRLPGNTSIIKHTHDLIDKHQDFALGYCDLDYFKPFNDRYGFARGDEVLMMTARIILNSVHDLALPFSFVGHIGGDDYVFIVPVEAAEPVCKKIVAAFDSIILRFYDAEDLTKNCIVARDRQNNVHTFPIMTISLSVVFNRNGSLKHYGEASSLAMSLKKVAKQSSASSYTLDLRGVARAGSSHA